jgi:hypothetical protein
VEVVDGNIEELWIQLRFLLLGLFAEELFV